MSKEQGMMVCKSCLMAIESHEGPQHSKKHFVDTTEDSGQCEWCEDDGFSELYEI